MTRTLIAKTSELIGEKVVVKGWVDSRRDHGKIIFIDLRDKTGIVQIVGTKELFNELKSEYVVSITGTVKKRPEKMINPDLVTGTIEIEAEVCQIEGICDTPPFPLNTDGNEINEELRLQYRYLDLRRERMRKTLILRSDYSRAIREALYKRGFTEVETPILTKATKEGARDFVVPSRFYPGKFYALPQSPQQYKQLLMTAGVERYFQLARCIRDEDLRADRGFEHTQIDVEMSFVNQQEVMDTIEDVIKEAIKSVGGKLQHEKFPVIDYKDAIKKYGADKFDLRNEEEKKNGILAFAWVIKFPFFKKVDKADVAEVRDGKSGWTFTHNPFSMPIPEHLEWHLKGEHIEEILTTQYDLVCNGYEVGGGSIRAHTPEILKATFKTMGYSDAQIEENVGHMLQAFRFGTPPHGGIGMGIDRHVMLLAGQTSLKEAIAFPMTSTGRTAIMDAPTELDSKQLKELGLKTA